MTALAFGISWLGLGLGSGLGSGSGSSSLNREALLKKYASGPWKFVLWSQDEH